MKTDEELMNSPPSSLTKTELEKRRGLVAKELETPSNYVPKDDLAYLDYDKL